MLLSPKNSSEPENSKNCNLIVFENVLKTYNIDVVKGKPKAITVEIDVDSQMKVSSRDWIGIFPCGWTDFRQNVNFEYMIGRPLDEDGKKWKLIFTFTHIKNELFTKSYQFVYVSHNFQVMGASLHFYFTSSGGTTKNDVLIDSQPEHKIYRQHSDTALESKNVKQLKHQFQLKNSAQHRRKLEQQVHMLQKELELSVAAQTKLRIELNHERDEKDLYKTFTHSLLTKVASGNVVHITDGYNNYMVYDYEHNSQNSRNNGISRKGYNQLMHPQPVWHWTWVPVLTYGIPSVHFTNIATPPRQNKFNEMICQKAPINQPVKKNGKRPVPYKNAEVPHSMLLKAFIGAQEKSLRILTEKLAKAIKKEPVQLHRTRIVDLDEAAASNNVKKTTVLVSSSEEENNSENACDLNNNSHDKSIYSNDDDDDNLCKSEECNQKVN